MEECGGGEDQFISSYFSSIINDIPDEMNSNILNPIPDVSKKKKLVPFNVKCKEFDIDYLLAISHQILNRKTNFLRIN